MPTETLSPPDIAIDADPYPRLVDERGRDTGFHALTGPARSAAADERLRVVEAGHRLIGFTGHLTFPHWFEPTFPRAYDRLAAGWCHCFREPERYLPDDRPRMALALSDFVDPMIANPEVLLPGIRHKSPFDFVYVCRPGASTELVKGWDLARRCLPRLCGELGLRGLLVGRPTVTGLPGGVASCVEVVGELPHAELLQAFGRARFVLVPNGMDPSSRVLAEALAMDTPVLVNRGILGGWHYVTPETGAFFASEHDVVDGARRCLDGPTEPRRWFRAHHGPEHAGRRLARFLHAIDPTVGPFNFVYPTGTVIAAPVTASPTTTASARGR